MRQLRDAHLTFCAPRASRSHLASARARQRRTFALLGVEARDVQVEVDVRAAACRPSRSSASPTPAVASRASGCARPLANSGLRVPAAADHREPGARRPAQGRPGLRPGDRRRSARGLRSSCRPSGVEARAFAGELALDGSIRPVPGSWRWPRPRGARSARDRRPRRNAREAALVGDGRPGRRAGWCDWSGSSSSRSWHGGRTGRSASPLWSANGTGPRRRTSPTCVGSRPSARTGDGAAAGGHSLLIVGPPGRRQVAGGAPSALDHAPAQRAESIEVLRVAAPAADTPGPTLRPPPFRAPHHTISTAGLVAAGRRLAPARSRSLTAGSCSSTSWRVLPRGARGAASAAGGGPGDDRSRASRRRASCCFMLVAASIRPLRPPARSRGSGDRQPVPLAATAPS